MVITKDDKGKEEPRGQRATTRRIKKQKRDPSYKEDIECFSYVLDCHDSKRDNVTYIQGYTGHWKDPVYIKLMNGRLSNKLKVFVTGMNHIIVKLAEAYEDNEEPLFITDLKRLLVKHLHNVYSKIEVFDDSLIHILSRESIARVLNIHNNEDVVNIIVKMSLTQDFDACLKYLNDSKQVEYELNFNTKEYIFKYMNNNPGIP